MPQTLGVATDKPRVPRGIGWPRTRGARAADLTKVRDHVAVDLPEASTRWRCGGCGNLTRFDVARSSRTTEFWHFDLAGGHAVESTEVVAEVVEQVTCRWCGRSDAIELVSRAEADAPRP